MFITCLGVFGPYPSASGATSGYLAGSGNSLALLDCGSGVVSRLMRFASPLDLSALVISHWHYDHMSDIFVLGYLLQSANKTLPLIAPEAPESIKALLGSLPFKLINIETADKIGGMAFSAVKTRHPVTSFAVKLKAEGATLVYTGDAQDSSNLFPFCEDADVLLCDAAFLDAYRKENAPHMSARMAAELAKKTKGAKLILTHFIPGTDLDALRMEAAKIYKNTSLAEENKRFEIASNERAELP